MVMRKYLMMMIAAMGLLIALPQISGAQNTPDTPATAAEHTEAAPNDATPSEGSNTAANTPENAPTAKPGVDAPTDKEVTESIKDETPTQPGDLLIGVQKTVNDWRTLGWLAGIIALLQLLMKILKFGPVDEWFRVNKKKWLKPYIAAGIGAVLGGFSTYATGAGILNSVVAGLMVGVTSVGWNELVNKVFQPAKREA
jgi:hypothetical protein